MEVALLRPEDPRWIELVRRARHDFYHLPTYVEVSARLDGGEPRALYVRDGDRSLLLPIVARPLAREGTWDATSPYGYPGPLVEGGDEDFAGAALDEARPFLRRQGCVSLFARLHPLFGAPPRSRHAALVQHGETVHVDLGRSTEEHWRETMSGHRNEINRAVRAGHRAFVDESFQKLDRFVEVYQSTMRRVGASSYYFFDRDYVVALREALGTRLRLVVVEIEEAVAAAGLFVETSGIVEYHLSGTDERFTVHRPTKLLLHFVRGWAKERGDSVLHLGGGVGGREDSLFKFKAGFSPRRTPFFTLRMVVDDDAYAALCRQKHPESDASDRSGFFPLYRRP